MKKVNAKTFCEENNLDWYKIRNSGQIFTDPPESTPDWFWHYFDMDTDYDTINRELSRFPELVPAIAAGAGIRILRQPFTQCVVSFIISANNNIKRFSKTIEQIDFNNLDKYTEKDFTDMGCGYRAPYLAKAVKQLKGLDYAELCKLDNTALRKTLMSISGVGRKVADCVMLFAFHRLDVAPVDTWIEKAQEHGINFSTFGKYAGVAQQYVFYYTQHLKKNL
ncbi:MAG: hypothetical protein LBG88_02950 [Christensenellaceae bacterium]|jgi:N-glycosylase/DNA lyase|nr:hypothetical protein [Christensenellaceae bacterium]